MAVCSGFPDAINRLTASILEPIPYKTLTPSWIKRKKEKEKKKKEPGRDSSRYRSWSNFQSLSFDSEVYRLLKSDQTQNQSRAVKWALKWVLENTWTICPQEYSRFNFIYIFSKWFIVYFLIFTPCFSKKKNNYISHPRESNLPTAVHQVVSVCWRSSPVLRTIFCQSTLTFLVSVILVWNLLDFSFYLPSLVIVTNLLVPFISYFFPSSAIRL